MKKLVLSNSRWLDGVAARAAKYLTLLCLMVCSIDLTEAQSGPSAEQSCVVTISAHNRNRMVDGGIDAECFAVPFVSKLPLVRKFWHSRPFGSWSAVSNYNFFLSDADHFPGWKNEDGPPTKLQWNSCTVRDEYAPPDCRYYNAHGCTRQESRDEASHGMYRYRTLVTSCRNVAGEPLSTGGCANLSGVTVTQPDRENFMTLYELDSPDGSELIETLYFPETLITLTSCSYDGCPEQTSDWVETTRSTNAAVNVEAELSMKVSVQIDTFCDWDW